jgi:hypothetical protein
MRSCSANSLASLPTLDGSAGADPKMPAHYIAQPNREKLGMEKVVAFDQSRSPDDLML